MVKNEVDTPQKTILVVEDSKFQRNTLIRQLKSWDFAILAGSTGKEGLSLFNRYSPRVIITDLEMPEMDGFELIKAVRRHELKYTYIVVLTAMADKENLVKALEVGADDFLLKPINLEELKVRLNSAERIFRLQSQDMLIFALAQLADSRSKETGNHLKRVQLFSKILASELAREEYPELTSAKISLIESMSCLHDIGKVAIPDRILNKPDKLTPEEFATMRKHSEIGGNLIDDIYQETLSEQLKIAKDIVMYHHERYDGKGYPEGLSGSDIPLAAKIVALADVFDALANERCYKPAFSREKCEDIIFEERGAHFDPAVVDAFFRREDEFWEVLENFKDDNVVCLIK